MVLEDGIPSQTGCLYGDGLGGGWGKEFCHSWMQTRCGKRIRSDRSAPRATCHTAVVWRSDRAVYPKDQGPPSVTAKDVALKTNAVHGYS